MPFKSEGLGYKGHSFYQEAGSEGPHTPHHTLRVLAQCPLARVLRAFVLGGS